MCAARREKIDRAGLKFENSRPAGEIEVLVRTEKPLSPQQQDQLQEVGYHTHFVMGKFSSGCVSNDEQLDKVAELPFVRKVERSFPLFKE
ncbi:hypothetical protein [Iningainema tapete]|uniref:Uncharacterized protein n=1 Tax=Iningainema tapete BLCC-T55 TaxID=2748662 RepID=A0A8J6XQ11_9CYAN|nr:hypothetical protein [Iningainema tapete]MBD2776095.1 hypothetical protein [Iningainema tapete BLCC-T55]